MIGLAIFPESFVKNKKGKCELGETYRPPLALNCDIVLKLITVSDESLHVSSHSRHVTSVTNIIMFSTQQLETCCSR